MANDRELGGARLVALVALGVSGCSFDPAGLSIAPGDPGDGGVIDAPRGDAGPAPLDAAPPSAASVWLTLPDRTRLLAPAADVAFGPIDPGVTTIEVDPSVRHQTMVGFGASLTESSAYVIGTALPASQREALLRRLFDPVAGIGLRVLRQPIGATDFALGNYSYDDTAPDLANFSIQRDRAHVLPLLRQIRAINPGLVLMASPWSPPGWMKTSGSLIGGSLRPDRRGVFAEYVARFVEAYAAEGVPVSAVTLQNEPTFVPPGYPGMEMDAQEQSEVIVDDLAPALAARGLSPEIFGYDHNWDDIDYPLELLDDPAVKARIAGTAFHCYSGDPEAQTEVHDRHPDRAIWITECSDGSWRGGFAASLRYDVETVLVDGIRNWAAAVIKWNLALDDRHGPTNGGCTNCRGAALIDRTDGAVDLQADFYALGHVARFVAPGAQRIASTNRPEQVRSVAFANPDGGIAVLVFNAGQSPEDIQIAIDGVAAPYTLPAGAVATFAWGGAGGRLDRTGWVATASRSDGPQLPARALDGDLATRWTSGADQGAEQWFALDLATATAFSAITLDAGGSTGDYPRRYDVRISDDGATWGAPIATGAATSELFTIKFPTVTARHVMVRTLGAADSWWSIHELALHR